MKDYKRLTKRCGDIVNYAKPLQSNFIGAIYEEQKERDSEIMSRLAELEDKIEFGELVEVPKGAVVLTPEERAEEMRLCNEERKQVVEEFAERVKMAFYYEFDELIPSIMADKIDELVKEVCGNEPNADRLR